MRRPLTDRQRAELAERFNAGDESMVLLEPPGSPVEVAAHPHLGPGGVVAVDGHTGQQFTPDEARRHAQVLLAAADHAEYGPGEWDASGWRPGGEAAGG